MCMHMCRRMQQYIHIHYIYIYIYIYGHPPPYDRPWNCISSLSRKGAEDQHSKVPRVSKNPKTQKTQPKFRIFGNLSGSLKIQKSSKILEFPKFQKSKNSNPSFGFLETRAGASKSKNRANSSTFQISKNPKIPTQVSDFWKLERERQNPKIEQIPRVSKIPNLGVIFLDFWNFGNSRNLLDFWIWRLPLEFPKFQKPKNSNPSLGFLETRTGASKSKNRANSSSFQNSKPWGDFFGFLEFWKLEEFARFLDFEAPVRVSKNPNLWGGFLDFWNFGNWSLYKIFSGVLI